jgi:hypothetical protein
MQQPENRTLVGSQIILINVTIINNDKSEKMFDWLPFI